MLESTERVRAVCSTEVLLASRTGKAADRAVYRCLGSLTELTMDTAVFGPG